MSPCTSRPAASASAATVRGLSSRSTLLSAVTAGTPARLIASAMKRSPGPMVCSPFRTKRTASASARPRSTLRCMRSVSASRGRCTPGRSTSTSCQSGPVAMPRISRRVVCGLSDTIATLPPTMRLTSVDFPALGRPARATKPERVTASPSPRPGARASRRRPRARSQDARPASRPLPAPLGRDARGRAPARVAARSRALPERAPRFRARRAGSALLLAPRRAQRGRLLLRVLVVRGHDALDELVAHHVLAAEPHELDALHVREDVADHDEAGGLVARKVDLCDIAGHDHLRVEAEPGKEHLDLLGARVLGLVEDYKRIIERSTPHER